MDAVMLAMSQQPACGVVGQKVGGQTVANFPPKYSKCRCFQIVPK